MYSNSNNANSRQIRNELRGKFPDFWTNEVISLLEYSDPGDLGNDDYLKCKAAAMFSPTLAGYMGLVPPTIDVQSRR